MSDIDEVRDFWERNPLYTGESEHTPGSVAFFNEHREVYINDCFAGLLDQRLMPPDKGGRTFDLGCGVGFWVTEFASRGYANLHAADLTRNAVELTRRRLDASGLDAELSLQNAEALSFEDGSFDHVNCQGVIHHTPDTETAVAEIARVLSPGGTACLSVYHRNIILRIWPFVRWFGRPLTWFGGGLKGRGREHLFMESDVDALVRLYDGADNPIGKSYSRRRFKQLLEPHFEVVEIFEHFFPARALPFPVPAFLHRWLDRHLGFMIFATVRKKSCAVS